MIFATTGTQLAFPRLMGALDALAPDLGEEVIAQTGPDNGSYPNLTVRTHLSPSDYGHIVDTARVIVAHAGIGSILTARAAGKPLILVPRRHDLSEHRNDHQMATARQVASQPGIHIAWEVSDLAGLLKRVDLAAAEDAKGNAARTALTGFVQDWIEGLRPTR